MTQPISRHAARILPALFAAALAAASAGCPLNSPSGNRPPRAQKWYERALAEFYAVDIDAAHDSTRHALDIVPDDEEVRVLAARVALARLEHDEVLRRLKGLEGAEVHALRGRAYWYKGDLERAADELERLLTDPEVDDAWAKEISKLARRGAGRKPFQIETTEGNLAAVQMARVADGMPIYVVPLEIDGDEALALVSTGQPEVMLDRATRGEPGWVSLRFGQRLEIKDVPALTEDLTALSHRMGAPIKALLGSNLLRHLNVTLDFQGRQFVARSFVPPPPPVASRIDLFYPRGGAMVLGGSFGPDGANRASMYVDSTMGHPMALDERAWRKIGVDLATLRNGGLSGDAKVRLGSIPLFQFGAFKLPQVTAIYGAPIDRLERELKIDIDGIVGAGLLSTFRITISEGGRVLWVEQPPELGPPPSSSEELPPAEPMLPGDSEEEILPVLPPPAALPSAPKGRP